MGWFADLFYFRRYLKALRLLSLSVPMTPLLAINNSAYELGKKHGLGPEETALLFSKHCGYECGLNGLGGGGLDNEAHEAWAAELHAEGKFFNKPEEAYQAVAQDFDVLRGEIRNAKYGQSSIFQ